MDNSFSQPSILPPTVPDSAELDAGTSKKDLITYIFDLLKRSQIIGISQSEPNPLDITQLASDLTALTARVAVVEDRTLIYRRQYLGVVDGDIFNITFPDIGGTNYEVIVNMTVASANGTGNFGGWALIDGLKTSTGFRMRFSKQTVPIDVTITVRKTNVPFS